MAATADSTQDQTLALTAQWSASANGDDLQVGQAIWSGCF